MDDKKKAAILSVIVIAAIGLAVYMGSKTMAPGANGEGTASYSKPPPSDMAPASASPSAGGTTGGATNTPPADGSEGTRGH